MILNEVCKLLDLCDLTPNSTQMESYHTSWWLSPSPKTQQIKKKKKKNCKTSKELSIYFTGLGIIKNNLWYFTLQFCPVLHEVIQNMLGKEEDALVLFGKHVHTMQNDDTHSSKQRKIKILCNLIPWLLFYQLFTCALQRRDHSSSFKVTREVAATHVFKIFLNLPTLWLCHLVEKLKGKPQGTDSV